MIIVPTVGAEYQKSGDFTGALDSARFPALPGDLILDVFHVRSPAFGFVLHFEDRTVVYSLKNIFPDLASPTWAPSFFYERVKAIVSRGETPFFEALFPGGPAFDPSFLDSCGVQGHTFVSGNVEYPFTRIISLFISQGLFLTFVIRDVRKTNSLYNPDKINLFMDSIRAWCREFDRENALENFSKKILLSWPDLEILRTAETLLSSGSVKKTEKRYKSGKSPRQTEPEQGLENNGESRLLVSFPGLSARQNQSLVGALFSGEQELSAAIMEFMEIKVGLYMGGLIPVGVLVVPFGAVRKNKTMLGALSETSKKIGRQSANRLYISEEFSPMRDWLDRFGAFDLGAVKKIPGEKEEGMVAIPFHDIKTALPIMQQRTRSNDFYFVDEENDRGVVVLRECFIDPSELPLWKFFAARGLRVDNPVPFLDWKSSIQE